MSIAEGDKIDMVLTDKEKTHAILVIADHLDWQEDEGEHLVLSLFVWSDGAVQFNVRPLGEER